MRLRDIRFGILYKFIGVTLIPIVILLLSVVLVLHDVQSSAYDFALESKSYSPLMIRMEQLSRRFYRWDDDLNMAVLALLDHRPSMVSPQLNDAQNSESQLYSDLESAKQLGMSTTDYARLKKELDIYADYSNVVTHAIHSRNLPTAIKTQLITNANISNTLTTDLNRMKNQYYAQYQLLNERLHAAIRALRITLYTASAIALVLSLGIAIVLARRLVEQVQRLILALKKVANGNRQIDDLYRSTNDEIGDAFAALYNTVAMLNEAEGDLHEQLKFRKLLLNSIPVPVFYKDTSGKYLEVNHAFEAFHGKTINELVHLTILDLAPAPSADEHYQKDQEILSRLGSYVYESTAYDAMGKAHDVIFHKATFQKADGEIGGIIGIMIDISEHKEAERHIKYLTQMYAALAQTNQTIVHCKDEQILFDEVCRIAVEFGGMKLAWIGQQDTLTGKIIPIASDGAKSSLNGLVFSINAKDQTEAGLIDTALRENHYMIVQSYADDERPLPYRSQVLRYGFESGAAFPIIRAGQVYAALTVFHGEPQIFDENMIALLQEMCMDIGFALDQYDVEAKRMAAEKELELSAKVFEQSHEGIAITDTMGNILTVNKAFTEITGYGEEEVIGKTSGRKDLDFYRDLFFQQSHHGHWQGEVWNRRRDGIDYIEWLSLTEVRDEHGNVTNYISIFSDITERKRAEDSLRDAENRYRTLFEESQDAMMTIEPPDWHFTSVNPATLQLFLVNDETHFLQLGPLDISPERQPDGALSSEKSLAMITQAMEQGANFFEWTHKRSSGEEFPATVLLTRMEINGKFLIQATVRDITEQKRAEQALLETERRWKDVVNFLPDATFVIDKESKVIAWNHAMELLTGIPEAEMVGKGDYAYAVPFYGEKRPILIDLAYNFDENNAYLYNNLWLQGDTLYGETVANLPAGKTYLNATASVLRSPEGEVIAVIESIRDITERKLQEAQIQHLAHFDPLTGLPNRTLLTDRANQLINWAQHNNGTFSLLFLDLDHFKNINDTLGHKIGDLLLVEVGKRLSSMVEEQDTVSRIGGDEFILLLPSTNEDTVGPLAQSMIQSIALPFRVEGYDLTTTPSIGIAIYPVDGDNWDTLYKHADIAMYRAKHEGRNSFCFFTEEMQKHSERRLQLENALRMALEKNEFLLYYQPLVSLSSNTVTGVEALLRWKHTKLGMISPAEFIPIAEDSGLIIPIGEWALRTAIRQMKSWLNSGFTLKTMAVNLSALQLNQFQFPEMVLRILEEEGLPPDYLELEITESVAMKEPEKAIRIMDVLHQRGVRMSIDDFGTGYSSLAYLNRFPIDKLKIDQSFVRDIDTDPDDEAIVKAVISMAKTLRLHTLAEGVETENELQLLRRNDCDDVQGYYFSRPLPTDDLEKWLNNFSSL